MTKTPGFIRPTLFGHTMPVGSCVCHLNSGGLHLLWGLAGSPFIITARRYAYATLCGLCCRPMSVRPSRSCIASTRLKISSNFLLGPVAPTF